MKKCFILILMLLFQGSNGGVHMGYEDLNTIIQTAESDHFTIEGWEIVYVGKMDKQRFLSKIDELGEKYNVQKTTKKEIVKYSLENKSDTLSEQRIYAILPQKNEDTIQIQIVSQGKEWNDNISRNMTKSINFLKKDLQFDDDGIFTCAKLNYDGIMNLGLLVEKLMDDLMIVHTKEIVDNVENTVYGKTFYGYSSLFNQSIKMTDETINFQLTTKIMTNNKKQVIIGTPLILNEY